MKKITKSWLYESIRPEKFRRTQPTDSVEVEAKSTKQKKIKQVKRIAKKSNKSAQPQK